ncbi:MAG: hypothetical protein QGG54_01830 [Gammaproteobacteria bacterium]|nr:hypothetical protein [Chromatiales bacterium]MDP6413774.1 hypothetical protein [Gammaproteobacteria bacterium]MDP6673572.1 hypothetical protein [Gammaproteobacteria bacterium]
MRHLIIALGLCAAAGSANAVDFALGAQGGTPGLGLNATLGISKKVNVRGVFNLFQYSFDENEDGVDYELDLDLNSFGALIDWHPMGWSFRISGGVFSNGNEISGTGRGEQGTTVEFGDMVFNADELGTVGTKIDFDSVAPYLGLGWGNAVGDGRWAFTIDIGVYFQGKPNALIITPEVDPSIAAQVAAEIANAEAELEDEIKNLDLYPYLSLGFAFKF